MARRTGQHLCVADNELYNMIDLNAGLLFPLLPLSQAPDAGPVKPSITVISDNEFLILSWTGTSTIGVFLTGEGDPVRGTLEWNAHPISIGARLWLGHTFDLSDAPTGFDDPYVMTLLPNHTVEVHHVDTQAITQVIPAPTSSSDAPTALISCVGGFFVPSMQRTEKLRMTSIKLVRSEAVSAAEKPREEPEPPIPREDIAVEEALEL